VAEKIETIALARKLADVKDGEKPTLRREMRARGNMELLWFIQWFPGGVAKLSEFILENFAEHVGTKTVRGVEGELTAHQLALLLDEFDGYRGWLLQRTCPARWEFLSVLKAADLKEIDEGETEYAQEQREEINRINIPKLKAALINFARRELPRYIAEYCHNPAVSLSDAPWFLEDLPDLLFRTMDLHGASAIGAIAQTEVARQIFDALDYALAESSFVMIEGKTRIGKTESLRAWCEARPGIARLITVPCMNSDVDFFRAIAIALGLELPHQAALSEVRQQIDFVLRYSRLCLVFDEAAFILPQRFSKRTPASRVHWLRSAVLDHNIPCAIVCSPESFGRVSDLFAKTTGCDVQQIFGARAFKVKLPNSVSLDDMSAIARVKFSDFDARVLEYLASIAFSSKGGLPALEQLAKRARFLAGGNGCDVRLQHLDCAISEITPNACAVVPEPARTLRARGAAASRSDPVAAKSLYLPA